MRAAFNRFVGSAAALTVTSLLFTGRFSLWAILFGSVMLTLLYILIRPLMQVIIAPFNLFLFGVLTPLADALLVLWTSAWISGLSLRYWHCIVAALIISLVFCQYTAWKKEHVSL